MKEPVNQFVLTYRAGHSDETIETAIVNSKPYISHICLIASLVSLNVLHVHQESPEQWVPHLL